MSVLTVVGVVGGLLLLVVGGDLLVRGSVRLAELLGVSPLLIGLTLVGFGTSAPELVTSVQASLSGAPGIALGNIVGSNLFNALVILGVAALMSPVLAAPSSLRRDGGVGVAAAAILVGVGLLWELTRPVGLALLVLLAAYLLLAWRQESSVETVDAAAGSSAAYDREVAFEGVDPGLTPHGPETDGGGRAWWIARYGALSVLGLLIIVGGARLLVTSSIELAEAIGVSQEVIGLTIVAAGTSMPELVTSVVAALRRQGGVALGNILGSNIYNVLGIAGVTGLLSPTAVPEQIARVDAPLMLGAMVLMWVLVRTGHRVTRPEGALLLIAYVAYLAFLWPS